MSQQNVLNFQKLARNAQPSPIDLNVSESTKLYLPDIVWNYFDAKPKSTKISNTGKTIVITAKWSIERPYLTGGPLNDKYKFAQIHYHWGSTASEGSEHTIDNAPLPLEMHAVFFNNLYGNPEEALNHEDGLISLVYFYKINFNHSEKLEKVFSNVTGILKAKSITPMEPFILSDLLQPFEGDYYLYWGMIGQNKVQWLITREVQHLSLSQLKFFRNLLHDDKNRPITRNYHQIQPKRSNFRLFHVNPIYKTTNSTLSPIMPALDEQLWKQRLEIEAAKYFAFDNKDQILPEVQQEEIMAMDIFEDDIEDEKGDFENETI